MAELIERFGPPSMVFAARGSETWQDDVIFRYNEGDFYIHRDRVWQVKVRSALGITVGDPRQAVLLTLGAGGEDMGTHIIFPIINWPGITHSWPLMLRVNLTAARVSEIFIYRADF